jgi:hypothetical protein
MNYIIGCGGVGSAIIPSFSLLRDPADITLIDGDTLERKNLDRQLFTADQIGRNKAQALGQRYGCAFLTEWYAKGKVRHHRNDWLLCLVDNHRTRLEVLAECDDTGCSAIFAANELHSSEAYHYRRSWAGTERDPRIYYPEMNTDRSGDPRVAATGCTGEAQVRNRQLVSANLMAAALAEHLYVLWALKAPRLEREVVDRLPHKLVANLSQLETHRGGHHE